MNFRDLELCRKMGGMKNRDEICKMEQVPRKKKRVRNSLCRARSHDRDFCCEQMHPNTYQT